MRTNRLLVIFLILVSFSAYAEGDANGHSFSLGFSVGMLSGASKEIIYRSSSTNSYLSQLIWQLNPLVYYGVDLGYSWQNHADSTGTLAKVFSGFFVDASFKFGPPGDTGLMEDRDWLHQPIWASSHLSIHDNRTEIAMLAALDIGKSFKLYNESRLGVFLSYNVMYYAFAARGGIYLYPDYHGGHFYEADTEKVVVTYKQFWQILSPGVFFYGVFNSYFNIKIFMKATPLITASSFDEHLEVTRQIIIDPMYYGLSLEPGLVFTFNPPASKFALSLSLNYKSISGNRGDLLDRYPNYSKTYSNTGGAGYSAFDIGISARFELL